MASFTLIIEAKLGSNNFTHKELHQRVLSKARKHWEQAQGHLQAPARPVPLMLEPNGRQMSPPWAEQSHVTPAAQQRKRSSLCTQSRA